MIIHNTRTSKGTLGVTAEVKGSYGEIVRTQVGPWFSDEHRAVRWAMAQAAKHGWTGVVVRDRNTGWQYTVAP